MEQNFERFMSEIDINTAKNNAFIEPQKTESVLQVELDRHFVSDLRQQIEQIPDSAIDRTDSMREQDHSCLVKEQKKRDAQNIFGEESYFTKLIKN